MPNPQIQFPANFTTASAIAYTNADGTVQLVSADNPLPTAGGGGGGTSGGLTDTQLRASPVRSAISPKNWPSPNSATRRGAPATSFETATTPRSTRKKLSPGLPSSRMRSPAE